MAPQNRPRARSSVDHLFDLVESLEEDQLQSFLAELDSTPDTNIDVSSGVAYFEEQRRQQAKQQQVLRATPSFLNASPEPVDWPRQKPRPVSGSQWRQSMRIVSAPYARHHHHHHGAGGGPNEPVSPPLTASPPASPPLPPAPKIDVRVDSRQVEEPSPVSPPRHLLGDEDEMDVDDDDADGSGGSTRPEAFGAFSFARLNRAAEEVVGNDNNEEERRSRPVSPAQLAVTPPPEPQQPQPQQLPAFSRMDTMPALHHTPLSFDAAPARPRTSMGLSPRAFRRVSRPAMFLGPAEGGADELAGRLSAYLFGGAGVAASVAGPSVAKQQQQQHVLGARTSAMEDMLKEPGTPRGRAVFGRGEGEGVPVSGIFEVLTEG